jgi:hypothetical protein
MVPATTSDTALSLVLTKASFRAGHLHYTTSPIGCFKTLAKGEVCVVSHEGVAERGAGNGGRRGHLRGPLLCQTTDVGASTSSSATFTAGHL